MRRVPNSFHRLRCAIRSSIQFSNEGIPIAKAFDMHGRSGTHEKTPSWPCCGTRSGRQHLARAVGPQPVFRNFLQIFVSARLEIGVSRNLSYGANCIHGHERELLRHPHSRSFLQVIAAHAGVVDQPAAGPRGSIVEGIRRVMIHLKTLTTAILPFALFGIATQAKASLITYQVTWTAYFEHQQRSRDRTGHHRLSIVAKSFQPPSY